MTNLINRYIAKEVIIPFFLGIGIFTIILLMDKIVKLIELVVSKGVKLSEVISLIIYILPSFMVITIPMAFLLAVLLAFGRLSTDEEITALKSSGVGLYQMMPPVIVLSLIAFTISLFLMMYALPWGNHSFKTKIFNIVKRKADTEIIPGRIIDSFKGMVMYVSDYDKSSGLYKGVILSERERGSSEKTVIAKEGEFITRQDNFSVILRLYDGSVHSEGDRKSLKYNIVNFKTYDITLSMGIDKNVTLEAPKGDRELNITELFDKSQKLKAQGKRYEYLMVELHKKFSIPFACIVFALIGAPLGIKGRRSGKAYGFLVSLIIITIYWICLLWGETLGDRGQIPPFFSMWTPNILFFALGLLILKKANGDSEILVLSLFENLYIYIADSLKSIFKQRREENRD